MLKPGVYPAAVTPFGLKGEMDGASLAKLLAYFESAGCQGCAVGGSNGEGYSLIAREKKELLESQAAAWRNLKPILGVATSSIEECAWLCRRAEELGAVPLVMAPGYYPHATEELLHRWFMSVLDRSTVPLLLYNFPQRAGAEISPQLLKSLAHHPNLLGIKDSSGRADNLGEFREVLTSPEHRLFVGDETLLGDALAAGWHGTISGAANVIPEWLSSVVSEYFEGSRPSALAKFEYVLPCIQAIRKAPQPGCHKAILKKRGILEHSSMRPPLTDPSQEEIDRVEAAVRALGCKEPDSVPRPPDSP